MYKYNKHRGFSVENKYKNNKTILKKVLQIIVRYGIINSRKQVHTKYKMKEGNNNEIF